LEFLLQRRQQIASSQTFAQNIERKPPFYFNYSGRLKGTIHFVSPRATPTLSDQRRGPPFELVADLAVEERFDVDGPARILIELAGFSNQPSGDLPGGARAKMQRWCFPLIHAPAWSMLLV
jgi:hypothetical protein